QVREIEDDCAICEIDGVKRKVSLMMVEGTEIGDYVLIHAGFAIERLDKADAEETIRLFRNVLAEGEAIG
ncbi:MAG: HypC/HybG/HupF family hydrogenase formation chaperone, partial [Desulfuromonadales bacterium]